MDKHGYEEELGRLIYRHEVEEAAPEQHEGHIIPGHCGACKTLLARDLADVLRKHTARVVTERTRPDARGDSYELSWFELWGGDCLFPSEILEDEGDE